GRDAPTPDSPKAPGTDDRSGLPAMYSHLISKSSAVLEGPAAPTEPMTDTLHPRGHRTRPKKHGPQDGEDPDKRHPHFVRGSHLGKLRRERIRLAQDKG